MAGVADGVGGIVFRAWSSAVVVATTAHLAALYPFHADAGLGPRGTYIGEDISAGGSAWSAGSSRSMPRRSRPP